VLRVNLRLEFEVHDEIGGVTGGGQLSFPLTSLVERTVVHAISLNLIFKHGLQPDDREQGDGDLVVHLVNHSLSVFPLSAFDVASVYVYTSIRCKLDALKATFSDVSLEAELVNFESVLTGMHLEGSCLESLREEETRNPIALRRTIGHPIAHESDAFKQVIEPRAQGFERRVGPINPHYGYFTIQEVEEHQL